MGVRDGGGGCAGYNMLVFGGPTTFGQMYPEFLSGENAIPLLGVEVNIKGGGGLKLSHWCMSH